MKHSSPLLFRLLCAASALSLTATTAPAALLAYEPFTNAVGSSIIGSADGFGFSGAWQANGSAGVATNTAYGLAYTDAGGNRLATSGGAGFFQGLTSANTSMQPIRPFGFSRGTNGTDGVTTWISFLVVRQGPTVAGSNPYPRGANVPHDLVGNQQKLAIGNSSGATTNTVGLIPMGASGNLKASTSLFSTTNFIVVRVDHLSGAANDNAYLFVNPSLAIEPGTGQAATNSIGTFDFSFDRLRIFAGGNSSASQPYAELVVDEYRTGETYADVTPHTTPTSNLVITNVALLVGSVVLSGTGGTPNADLLLLAASDLSVVPANWDVIASNSFDPAGNFTIATAVPEGAEARFYRVRVAPLVAPVITQGPTNQTALAGQTVQFTVSATGTAPLSYQWFFNSTALPGATDASLTLNDVQTTNEGPYSVQVANGAGSVMSDPAALTVLSPPVILSQPASLSVVTSNNATFTVVATGTAPLHWQWFYNTNIVLTNATAGSWTVTNTQSADAGAYSVVITNDYGSVTSAVAVLTVLPYVPTNGTYFVSLSGNDSNPGTIDRPFLTITKGLNTIGNGGLLYLRGGTYALPSKLSLSRTASPSNRIRIWAYPGESVIFDATGNSSDGIGISGHWYYLKGITVVNAGHNGINISGNSNIVEFCVVHDNGNTGLHITGSSSGTVFPSYNLITNCDAYLNYDPPIGGNADGFSAKWNLGPGNVFTGCRAWWNSDDGWDLWMGNDSVIITNCWAFWQGTNYWNSPDFNGNGNGFKLGGNYIPAPHRLIHSLAFQNQANGIDQNNNIAGQTVDQNTAWANKKANFALKHGTNTTPHVVRNNVSIAGASGDSFTSGTLATNNSWQVLSPAANTSDVLSIDTSLAVAPRQSDGSLPVTPFLQPVPGGRFIDRGVNIGEPYSGAAPDLGAYEYWP